MGVDADITLMSGIDLTLAGANLLPENQIKTLRVKAVIEFQVSELLIPE